MCRGARRNSGRRDPDPVGQHRRGLRRPHGPGTADAGPCTATCGRSIRAGRRRPQRRPLHGSHRHLCESEALARLLARNAAVRRMGKVSGAWMRSCGLPRMRRLGQGRIAGPLRRHRPRPPTHDQPPARLGGLTQDEAAQITPTKPVEGKADAHRRARRTALVTRPVPPGTPPAYAGVRGPEATERGGFPRSAAACGRAGPPRRQKSSVRLRRGLGQSWALTRLSSSVQRRRKRSKPAAPAASNAATRPSAAPRSSGAKPARSRRRCRASAPPSASPADPAKRR